MLPFVLHGEYLVILNTVPTKQRSIGPLQAMPDVFIVEGLRRDQSVQQQREIFDSLVNSGAPLSLPKTLPF